MRKSTASRFARNLEDAGLVERTTDAEDRRSIRLSASQAGERTHAGIGAELRSEYASLLEDFEPDVRSAMNELFGRLTRAVGSRVRQRVEAAVLFGNHEDQARVFISNISCELPRR